MKNTRAMTVRLARQNAQGLEAVRRAHGWDLATQFNRACWPIDAIDNRQERPCNSTVGTRITDVHEARRQKRERERADSKYLPAPWGHK